MGYSRRDVQQQEISAVAPSLQEGTFPSASSGQGLIGPSARF